MGEGPYTHNLQEQLILRDCLAADRTRLANERTFLAYVRTSLALIAGGASFIQFFDTSYMQFIGYICIPSGIIAVMFGLLRFRKLSKKIPTSALIQMPAYDPALEQKTA